jgi:hypothetical protein
MDQDSLLFSVYAVLRGKKIWAVDLRSNGLNHLYSKTILTIVQIGWLIVAKYSFF